ncbi:MAG: hypothetical protein MZV63_13120 [Marinilabiliales bacterium]|nr:hypothetical protein [Marinilabiliales bacterium]
MHWKWDSPSTRGVVYSSILILLADLIINPTHASLMIQVENIFKSFNGIMVLEGISVLLEKGKPI